MTMDDGIDNPLPISKQGLLAAIETAIEIIVKDEKEFAVEYLERLYKNIHDDNATRYADVINRD